MESPVVECLAMDRRVVLRVADIARACGESETWVLELVQAAVLEPLPAQPGTPAATPCFAGEALFVARSARRLQRDLGVNLEGAALALQLLERIDELHARLRRAGVEP